jgi:hypothetical protein
VPALRWDPAEEIGLDDAEPDYTHYDPLFYAELPEDADEDELYHGRHVVWTGRPGYMLKVKAENVVPMLTNPFNAGHMAAIVESIEEDKVVLEAPPARVEIIDGVDIDETQEAEERGDLWEWNMTRPWTDHDAGEYYAVLTDNNHRTFAALAAGEPYVWVFVLPNHRDNVDPEDFE